MANRFQDLICYQLARALRRLVAKLIRKSPLSRDFDLCDQMRRAARSVTGNIAEGFRCRSHAEFARFLDISTRSLSELEERLLEATDEELLTQTDTDPAFNLVKRTSVCIARLTAYLRRPSK